MCLRRKEQISLSRFTVARRIDDLSENIKVSLKDRISKCSALSIALDESTDLSDTAQLVVFIRGVTDNFEVIQKIFGYGKYESNNHWSKYLRRGDKNDEKI